MLVPLRSSRPMFLQCLSYRRFAMHPAGAPSSDLPPFRVAGAHRGKVARPMTWDEMRPLIQENTVESLGHLGRLPGEVAKYRAFRSKTLEEWESMTSFLYHRIWRWPPSRGDDGKLTVLRPAEPSRAPLWTPNDFPYTCEPGVQHHNIWCTEPLADSAIEDVIAEHRPSSAGFEAMYFVNPTELQSVPTIWHAHVFSRKKPSAQ